MDKLINKKIIFDLGAVILDIKKEQDWWQEDLLPNFNQEQLLKLFEEQFFNNFEKGRISVDRFLATMQSIKINTEITVTQAWNAILKTFPPHRIALLYQLKENNQIFLLSNTNQIHTDAFLNDIKVEYGKNIFDDIFTLQFYSQKVGMRKPDAAIYHFVQDKIGEKDSENIYFLDDKSENLVTPRQLGWNTILVDRDIAELISIDLL